MGGARWHRAAEGVRTAQGRGSQSVTACDVKGPVSLLHVCAWTLLGFIDPFAKLTLDGTFIEFLRVLPEHRGSQQKRTEPSHPPRN